MRLYTKKMAEGKVLSAGVVREGGVAAAVARMCFGNRIGFTFHGNPDLKTLYAPLSGGLILELKDENELFEEVGGRLLGKTNRKAEIVLGDGILELSVCLAAWRKPL